MRRATVAALGTAIGVACTPFAVAQPMTKADYEVERKTVVSDFRTARTGCEPMSAHVRAICFADVRGREAIRLAELEELYQPGPGAREGVRVAKAQAAHSLAVEKCGSVDGNAKEACLVAAKRLDGKS